MGIWEDKIGMIAVFLFFFVSSLFLGDGKQPFVDVWWALGILTMYGVRYYRRGGFDLQSLPRSIGTLWIGLIVYYAMLIPFSDSAGYSISATIRLIEGYLIYVLFYAVAQDSRNQKILYSGNQQTIEQFTKGLLFVGVVATLASFVFLINPSLARFLPPMNLLYANYGHNHLADLLLFVIPLTMGLVEKKKTLWSSGALVLLVIGMIFTFARGAWILLVLYLVIRFIHHTNGRGKKICLAVAAIVVLVFLTTSLVSIFGSPQKHRLLQPINAFIYKPPLPSDNRWEYWRQSLEAMKERPVFGSGPGTFYLLSRRYQSAPSTWSWFSHSFPLQTAAETGLVGLTLMTTLFWYVFWRAQRGPLLTGTMLLLAYGAYEFVFDYASLWILFWAAVGLLTQSTRDLNDNIIKRNIAALVCLIILIIFYSSSLISQLAKIFNVPKVAFYSAPYLIDAVRPNPIGRWESRLIRIMHSRNPDAIRDRYIDNLSLEPDEIQDLEQIVYWDPKNTESAIRTAQIFSKTNNIAEAIVVYKHVQNQQMTGAQREAIHEEIVNMIEKNEGRDIFLLDLYELAFSYNRWTNVAVQKIYNPTERMTQLIQYGESSEAKIILSRFLSIWPMNFLTVNMDQKRAVVSAGLLLGEVLDNEGRTDEAMRVIQKILDLEQRRADTIKKFALLAIKNGKLNKFNSAQQLCERSYPGEQWCNHLVVDNDLAQRWKEKGLEELDQKNIIGAIEKLQLAVAAYPYGGEYYRPLIESLVRLNYQEEAKRVVRRCMERNKSFGGARWCNDFL